VSDAQGAFAIDGVLPHTKTLIVATARGFEPAREEVTASANGLSHCILRLRSAAVLTVEVRADEALLRPGDQLVLLAEDALDWDERVRRVALDGAREHVFRGLMPGTFVLSLEAEHVRAPEVRLTLQDDESVQRALVATPRQMLPGIVVDSEGVPVGGASVTAKWDGGSDGASSAGDGIFRLDCSGAGPTELSVVATGFIEHRESWTSPPQSAPGSEPYRIVMDRGLGVRCRATLDGVPLETFDLESRYAPPSERLRHPTTVTKAVDGVAIAGGFEPGRLLGVARAVGRDGRELVGAFEARLVEGHGLVPVVVRMELARVVSGVITTSAGVPLEDARIRLLSGDGSLLSRKVFADIERSAADGSFRIDGLLARDYVLSVARNGYEARRVPLDARSIEAHQVVILDERD
jgi:hypothetical protein